MADSVAVSPPLPPPRSGQGKKTVLLRRRVPEGASPASLPAHALSEAEVRERAERAAQATQQRRDEQARREEAQAAAQREAMQQQAHLLHQSSEPLSPATRKALLVRRVPSDVVAAAPAAALLGASLPRSLALASAVGVGPGCAGWTGPPRDHRTGALAQWEVLGSTDRYEQAEQSRFRNTLQQQQQQLDEDAGEQYDVEEKYQNQFAPPPATTLAAPLRSSRLAKQLTAELAYARELESREAAAAAGARGDGASFEARLVAGAEGRVLRAHQRTQASWAAFKAKAARELGVAESDLNISRTDAFRPKVEEADLLDKARGAQRGRGSSESSSSAGVQAHEHSWAGSLRGIGHSYVQVGNMFSGLFTRVRAHSASADPKVEIIRRVGAGGGGNEEEDEGQAPRTFQQGSLSQLAPPRPSAHAAHTWQHSPFLAARRSAQSKHIARLVRNGVTQFEQDLLARGLQTSAAGEVLDSLHIRGEDLLALDAMSEAEWYAARMGGEAEDTMDHADDSTVGRKKKIAKHAVPFGAPVQGPSLVASASRLFFPLVHGPTLASTSDASSSSALNSLPGQNGRVSRSVTLYNNGTTAVHYTWKQMEGVLETRARRVGESTASSLQASSSPSSLAPSPLASASDASRFFVCAQPSGTLLPGDSVDCTFTFLPEIEGAGAQRTGAFIQRMRLETEPKLPPNRHLTPWHAHQSASSSSSTSADTDPSSFVAPLPALVLSGSNDLLDTTSVARAKLFAEVIASKNSMLSATQLRGRVLERVPEPQPPAEQHRAIFQARNASDASLGKPQLFYYSDAMPAWHQLSADIFAAQRRLDRSRLSVEGWNFSAEQLQHWIARVPPRNGARRPELQARFDALCAQCRVRPAPNPTRYEVCFGLLAQIAAGIPRMASELALAHGTSEPLEQERRKEMEAAKRRAEEEARAKLPFHLRGAAGGGGSGAGMDPRALASLTPEQRRLREEDRARQLEFEALQAADDQAKREERAQLEALARQELEGRVAAQLRQALNYFDFLAAPANTDQEPQASKHTEETHAQAVQGPEEVVLDVAALLHRGSSSGSAVAAPAEPSPLLGPKGQRPRSSGGKREREAAAGATPKSPMPSPATGKAGKDALSLAVPVLSHESGGAGLTEPGTPVPGSSSSAQLPTLLESLTAHYDLSSDEALEVANILASEQHPSLLSRTEVESLRARSLRRFIELERARRARSSTSPAQRTQLVYFGNGYATPDTGVHIPSAAEIRAKEERDRMARYGQLGGAGGAGGKAEREAEARRLGALHPLSNLATRSVLLTAASSLFSMVVTRERGVYAWVASDAVMEALAQGGGVGGIEGGAGEAGSGVASVGTLVTEGNAGSNKKKGGASSAGSSVTASANAASKVSQRTRLQDARRYLLGLHLVPTTAPSASSSGGVAVGTGALLLGSKAVTPTPKHGGGSKASPRGSIAPTPKQGGGGSASNKKPTSSTLARPGSGQGDQPGSGSNSVRSGSPAPPAVPTAKELLAMQPSLAPLMPRALLPLGALCVQGEGASWPVPAYIPELQGVEIVSLALGVHSAFLLTDTGSLLLWEHASRKLRTILQRTWPGLSALAKQQWTERAVQEQLARDRAEGIDSAAISAAAATAAGTHHIGNVTARPSSRGGQGQGQGNSPALVGRKQVMGGSESSRRAMTAAAASSLGSPVNGGTPATGDKKSSRKPAGGSTAAGASGASHKKKGGAHDDADVLSIDSAAYEAEQERLARVVRDSDLATAGKLIASVVVGGSATLSSLVTYASTPAPAPDFEFVLLLTEDGCVYSAVVPPPAWVAAEAAAGSTGAAGSTKGGASASSSSGSGSGSGSSSSSGASSGAGGGSSKGHKDLGEKSTAMLGLGEKSKDALKAEKDAAAASAKDKSAPPPSSNHYAPDGTPNIQFELVQALHPVTLSAGLYSAAAAASAGTTPTPTPSAVVETRVVQLSAGYGHVVALCSDGSVYCWGNEGPWLGHGLGDKEKRPRFTPTLLPTLSQVRVPLMKEGGADAAAASAAPGPVSDPSPRSSISGKVPGIKVGTGSAVGTGTRPPSGSGTTPAKPSATGGKKGGGHHSAASLELDLSSSSDASGLLDPVVRVCAGAFHALALTQSGAVFAWGRGAEGQLGLGDVRDRDLPTLVTALSPSHQPAMLQAALAAANAPPPPKPQAGQAGANRYGAYGSSVSAAASNTLSAASVTAATASSSSPSSPSPLSPFLTVVSVSAGGAHSLVSAVPIPAASHRDSEGNLTQLAHPSVLSFGHGLSGALGLGPAHVSDDVTVATPVVVPHVVGQQVRQLVACGDASQAIVQRPQRDQNDNASASSGEEEDDLPDAVLI